MSFLKKIESLNRRFMYSLLKRILRTKQLKVPINASKFKKFLILRYDAVGDMVVTTPVFDLIKQNLPDAEIHVLASHRNYSLLRHDSRIKKYFILVPKFFSVLSLARKMRKERYDAVMVIIFNRTTIAGLAALLFGGAKAVRIYHLHRQRENLYSAFFNAQIDIDDLRGKRTMAEILPRMFCRAFGWSYPDEGMPMSIALAKENYNFADNFVKSQEQSKFFILNISSGNAYRKWSKDKNIELLKQIFDERSDLFCVITAAPDDYDEALAISAAFPKKTSVAPKTNDILNVAAVIGRAFAVITPDTSITHIAAVFKLPTVVMYSLRASYIEEWEPYGTEHEMVFTETWAPLETIPTDDVTAAFFRLINN